MKLNSENNELDKNQINMKKRRKRKATVEDEGTSNMDDNMKELNKSNDVNILERNSPSKEYEVIKKRKEKCEPDVLEMSRTSEQNTKIKGLKSIQGTEHIDNDEENVEDNKDINNPIDGKSIRASFNSINGLEYLRQFIKSCNENEERDLAAEYLNAGGNILELLRLLDSTDKKSIGSATIVFSAVRIILLKILAEYPQYQSSAEGACRHLINSHLSLVHSMLSLQSNAKQRKIILQLLAAVISLGRSLPRELIAHLSLQPELIKSLARHTKPTDNQNIRNCFIHFILAFLIEGNVSTIRALLNKHGLLSSIFPDLIYDSQDIVALVVTTLKTYILQNSKISKTMKLHIFTTSVIQNLVYLYNWKGPNNWPGNRTQSCFSDDPQYLEEKRTINEIVHDFLIVLLTSHRHGIIFHDYTFGTSQTKHNQLVNIILQSLDRPWEHEKPSDLVIRIVTACPDLIKSQFTLLEQHLEARVSTKWIAAMKFVREIIVSLNPEGCFKRCSVELNVSQLASAVMSLLLSGTILKHAILPSLTHSSIIVRHEAVLTLITMFNQIQKFLLIAKVNYNEYTDFDTFKSSVLEYILKNAPNINTILDVWNYVFAPNETEHNSVNKECIPEPKKDEHLLAILNLLHLYNEICPKLLHALLHIPATTFLSPLNTLQDVDIIELNTIRVKAIQFLIILNPAEFLPQKKVFSDALTFLLSLMNNEDFFNVSSIKSTIKMLLNVTSMFEGCNDHLDIWINGFVNLDGKQEVVDWFVRLLKKVAKNIERYVDEIVKTDETVSEGVIYAGRLEDIFNELMDKNVHKNSENNILHMQRFTSISPLLCCMIHKMEKNVDPAILSYASYVLVHTLHYQAIPQSIIHLTRNIQDLPVQKYLQSWSEGNDPIYIEEVIPSMDLLCKLNRLLLDDTNIQINEVFSGDNTVTFKYNNEVIRIQHSLSSYEIMCLFKMTVFYLTQFAKQGLLSTIKISNYKILLISLLYLAKESQDDSTLVEKCAKSIFAHPIILYYFSPLYQKSKDLTANMITLIIHDICKEIVHLYEKCKIRTLISQFRNKLLTQLHKMIDDHKNDDNINNVETITTLLILLELTPEDIVHLLRKLVKLENSIFISKDGVNLSKYGYITPKLLEIISINKIKCQRNSLLELDVEFVKCLCSHLCILKSKEIIDIEMWESALHEYISKFPFNIAGINADIFSSLLSTKCKHTTVKLLSFLISKNIKFIPIFAEYMLNSEKIKENGVVFPIIASNLNFKWNQEFLQKLKMHYESEITAYICNPKGAEIWIEENVNAVSYLIKNAFDLKNCSKICNTILQAGDKLDMVSIHYIHILENVFKTCSTMEANNEKFIMNLLQVLLHITTLTLKKESKNIIKLLTLCEKLNDIIKNLRDTKENFVFETLSKSHSWPQFSRFSLKLGFKELKNNKQPSPILKTLSALCDIAYKNDSNDEYAKTLFEMTVSHSEFLNIILESSNTRRDLIELLWILMRKNKTVITLAHVPVYLAAYNGTLSEADQFLLLILQYYENNNINIHEYRPYLWGNAAAVHYSVKNEMHLNLWKQPSTTQVLNLFEEDVINNTIKNYPVNRALKATELYEAHDIYDPAFYLPLLCDSLSENNVVSCLKVAQSGALALAFIACSSNHSNVRMAAYTIISRYYTHLEALSSKTKLLRMRLIDALRYGITALESKLDNVRLNSLVSIFFARTSLIATQPLHPLYSRLQIFLMAKPALDVHSIPELLQLFHSSDIEFKAHRHWILENIRDGMKTEIELDVAFKCVLFKMLLDFYTCNLSDSRTKELILEIICATLKITKACILLMKGHGLLPWLLNIAMNLRDNKVQSVELIIKIIDALLNTILKMKEDTIHYRSMLLSISLNLKSHLSKDIKVTIFTLYINILQKLFLSKHIQMIVAKEHLIEILEFSKKLLGDVDECEDILNFGCEYVTKINCSKSDNEIEVARNCLRTMIWTWCSHEIR